MNVYEFHIERLQKQIERIKANPDPTKLKSNLLLYEIQLESNKAQSAALRERKPQATMPPGLGILYQALGFYCGGTVDMAKQTFMPKFLEKARTMGLPVDTSCDMAMGPLATWASGEEMDRVNLPICQYACNPFWLSDVYRSHISGKPMYYMDRPYEESEATLKHLVNQLREYIEVCEKKWPRFIKYDEDRLIELQEYKKQAEDYNKEIYQMQKNKPAPLAGKSAFRLSGPNPPGLYPNPRRAVEYARVRRDEVGELVAKGIGGVQEEKLRMVWTVTRPWFMDPFPVLEKRGAAVLLHYWAINGAVPLPSFAEYRNRRLNPLEKVAAEILNGQLSGSGPRYIATLMWIAKDLQLDAIINYNMLGCTAALGLKKPLEEEAEKLGVSVLQLEGKQWDSNFASEETINNSLDEFAQMCLGKKGLN